jgi:hypothetical protein
MSAALPVLERLALPLIVLAGAAFAAYYSLDVEEWRVMTDELLYVRLALHVGETFSPLPEVHGQHVAVYNVLYPVLLAPLVTLFSLPTAIHLAHGLNALLFASAAIPAYLLTRWVVPSRVASLAVAALTVLVPWIAFSLSLLTEVVGYPAVVWAVYAIVRTVAQPSGRADVLALVAIAIAYAARTQFVFLFAVLPAAIALHGVSYGLAEAEPGRRWQGARRSAIDAVTRHPVVWGAVALGVIVLLVGENVYGSYRAYVDQPDLWPAGTGAALIDHVNQIAVGVAVLPVVLTGAFVVTAFLRPAGDRRAHALAAVLVILLPALTLIATSFDQTFGGKLPQERYIFYVVPFLFVGTAACLCARRPSPLAMLASAAVGAIALLQTEYVPTAFPPFASPTKFAYPAIDFRAHQLGELFGFTDLQAAPILAAGCLLATAVLAFVVRSGRARLGFIALCCVLAIWGVLLGRYSTARVLLDHNGYAANLLGPNRPDEARNWIDRGTPDGASVGMVPSPVNARGGQPVSAGEVDQAVWWDPGYWNKRVDRVFKLPGAQTYTPLPSLGLTIDRGTGALRPSSGTMPSHLLLAQSDVRFAPWTRDEVMTSGDLALYALERQPRAAWAVEGVTGDGYFADPRKGARLVLYPPPGAGPTVHEVTLLLDPGTSDPGTFEITAPGRRVTGPMRSFREVTFSQCVPAVRRFGVRVDLTTSARPRLAEVKDVPGGACSASGQDGR